jgi:hypothetical protein
VLVEFFPAVVPCAVPPTTPIRASTWQRTVALFALSTDPVSAAYTSMSPRSISTNSMTLLVPARNIGGR